MNIFEYDVILNNANYLAKILMYKNTIEIHKNLNPMKISSNTVFHLYVLSYNELISYNNCIQLTLFVSI